MPKPMPVYAHYLGNEYKMPIVIQLGLYCIRNGARDKQHHCHKY